MKFRMIAKILSLAAIVTAVSTNSFAQTLEHSIAIDKSKVLTCDTGYWVRPGLAAHARGGHITKITYRLNKDTNLFFAEFTVADCGGKKATSLAAIITDPQFDNGAHENFATLYIDAAHMYTNDTTAKANPVPASPVVTVVQGSPYTLLAGNHPSASAAHKALILESSVVDDPNAATGARIFRVTIDASKMNVADLNGNAGWKGLYFGPVVAHWVFQYSGAVTTYCTDPAACAGKMGIINSMNGTNGQYDIHGDTTNIVPECIIKMGPKIVPSGMCIPFEAGNTFTSNVMVNDGNANQKKFIKFESGQGKLQPGNIVAGQTLDVTATGIGSYELNIPAAGFAARYDAKFTVSDDGIPAIANLPATDECTISVCPAPKDNCPSDPNKTEPGLCGCGVADVDTDGDGLADCEEICDTDPNKTDAGVCGCGSQDIDTDGDGDADCTDDCLADPNKTAPGQCGCGVSDVDTDGDGLADCDDECPADPAKTQPGICDCGTVDADTDNDGVADCDDLCVNDAGKTSPGVCGCGESDADTNGDGLPDCTDVPEPNCDKTDVSTLLFSLDANAKAQKTYVDLALRMLDKHTKGQKEFIAEVRAASEALYLESWNNAWAVPRIVNLCTGAVSCVSVSHTPLKASYLANVNEMHELLKTVVKRLRSLRGKGRGKRLIERSEERLVEARSLVPQVPEEHSDCK